MSKEQIIEGIMDDIKAGKYFGRDALAKAYDAGMSARPEEPLLKPLAQAALDLSDALHRYEESGAPSLPVYIDNAWGNLTVVLESARETCGMNKERS